MKCLKIYQGLIAYNLRQSHEEVLIYNDYKRYGFINGILQKGDRYIAAMEALKKQHADHPLSASITSLIAKQLINQYESHAETPAYADNFKKAKKMCEEAMAQFPASEGADNCRNIVQYITDAQIQVVLKQVQLPHEAIPAVLEYRNCTHPYYRIVKVSHKELEALDKMNQENKLKALEKKTAIAEQTLSLPADTDYHRHSTLIALPALDKGIYYLTARTEKETKNSHQILTLCFQVSDITYIADAQSDQFTIVTLNRKTGKPVEGVTVELYRMLWDYKTRTHIYVKQVTKKYVTNKISSNCTCSIDRYAFACSNSSENEIVFSLTIAIKFFLK